MQEGGQEKKGEKSDPSPAPPAVSPGPSGAGDAAGAAGGGWWSSMVTALTRDLHEFREVISEDTKHGVEEVKGKVDTVVVPTLSKGVGVIKSHAPAGPSAESVERAGRAVETAFNAALGATVGVVTRVVGEAHETTPAGAGNGGPVEGSASPAPGVGAVKRHRPPAPPSDPRLAALHLDDATFTQDPPPELTVQRAVLDAVLALGSATVDPAAAYIQPDNDKRDGVETQGGSDQATGEQEENQAEEGEEGEEEKEEEEEEDLSRAVEWAEHAAGFRYVERAAAVAHLLTVHGDLAGIQERLVPGTVRRDVFWSRYTFRRAAAEEARARSGRLMEQFRRAQEAEELEGIGWSDDEDIAGEDADNNNNGNLAPRQPDDDAAEGIVEEGAEASVGTGDDEKEKGKEVTRSESIAEDVPPDNDVAVTSTLLAAENVTEKNLDVVEEEEKPKPSGGSVLDRLGALAAMEADVDDVGWGDDDDDDGGDDDGWG